jgi:predicted amidohydrolase
MKICAAQTRPVKADLEKNIEHHLRLIEKAVAGGAAIVIFPELSLTGYEPSLAGNLAIEEDDYRLNIFQEKSRTGNIVIGIGSPTRTAAGIHISLIIFQPDGKRLLYSKQFLHMDEEPFFTAGKGGPTIRIDNKTIAFAICYELSVPEHARNACRNGANIYIASVAKPAAGMEKAGQSLAAIAAQYTMSTVISNCVGYVDNFESTGCSAAWDDKGQILGSLSSSNEGLLFFDTDTGSVTINENLL